MHFDSFIGIREKEDTNLQQIDIQDFFVNRWQCFVIDLKITGVHM